jgi:hypothetical protein
MVEDLPAPSRNPIRAHSLCRQPRHFFGRRTMTWGKGLLLWLIGIPLPIIILLALFWR